MDVSTLTLGLLIGVVLTWFVTSLLRLQDDRRSQAAARASGEIFTAAIVEAAPDAMVATNAAGEIAWANEASSSIFGRSGDELRGLRLCEVLPAFEGRLMERWMSDHGINGRVIAHETVGQRVDGTRFPCAVSGSVMRLGDERCFTFVVRDTTDSRWAEQELLLRERALESAADGITILSMELPGEPIIFANPAFCGITGYSHDEVIGRAFGFLYGDGPDARAAMQEIRRAMAARVATRVVVSLLRKDGVLSWNELRLAPVVREDGRMTHYVGVHVDITERMAQEEMLRLRTERLNTIFDLSPDGFVAQDEQGLVRIVNPAFERMTGLPAHELLGQSRDLLEDRLAAICRGTESADAGAAGGDSQMLGEAGAMPVRTFGGELLHLASPAPRTLLRRVRRSQGTGHETVMYFRDMTREFEVDRMKSEFLSMAAHELRTPMASIFGFTELLLKRKFDEVRRQDMLATIHRQAGVLVNLVNELLDLARIEARRGKDFHRSVQPLVPILENTLAGILVHNDPRKVQVSWSDEDAGVLVNVDAEKLAQAVLNVVSNAYKYSSDGDIGLQLLRRDHDGIGVCVTDQGMGMTPEQLGRVFERFFRADTSGNIPGTGLGMTIVKEILELMDGQVEVHSEHGRGTRVTLWLRTAAPAPEPVGDPAPALARA
ncbi:PAS domain S-box-containing protein [Sphaerotilus hippei]|uniref:histidine kinase n=1 Tax=Sphaerotilus hippei TaxID=744406 RepID=A0A318H545_9BURK|nr:PAS domain S-box protein [Sphaerotilus hippei]PXW96520.1 PAS domain S-box-containing protein [Sphaerotilus hippei]